MEGRKNECDIINARIGMYSEESSVFTHWDPKTGFVFGNDLHFEDGSECWVGLEGGVPSFFGEWRMG